MKKLQKKVNLNLIFILSLHQRGSFLSNKKASQASYIPIKIIADNRDLMAYFILHNFNNALSTSEYLASLKYADITPIFRKDNKMRDP